MDTPSEVVETFRKAELRLRALLLGDGTETIGLAHRDDQRTRVITNLKQMRAAFDSLAAEHEHAAHAEEAEARVAQLEEDLLELASERAQRTPPDALVTPAEAAHELGMSTSSLYRAVRRGEIGAVRPAGRPMRIPASEVRRLAEESASTR